MTLGHSITDGSLSSELIDLSGLCPKLVEDTIMSAPPTDEVAIVTLGAVEVVADDDDDIRRHIPVAIYVVALKMCESRVCQAPQPTDEATSRAPQ